MRFENIDTEKSLRSKTSTIDIYIKLAQYPILSDQIRARMREEVFRRGIISEEEFEAEVEALAVESQKREGLYDPYEKEPANVWHERKARIRAFHTDFYFGYNLPTALFEKIIQQTLGDQPETPTYSELAFNPEVAPWRLLFRQGEIYEKLPPPQLEKVSHHLEEIKVVLIKGMISDQLPYIGVAKRIFEMEDLRRIFRRRIGKGKIGGKAAGMLLAWKILQLKDPAFGPDMSERVEIPTSYFLGTEVIYEFRRLNNLDHYMNQKYRPQDEIQEGYDEIVAAHMRGEFPMRIQEQLRQMLRQMDDAPMIVRSSSLLEDNFGFSFAGKYHSYFCPNQGTEEENFQDLLDAIRRVYASSLNPDALLYRQRNNLIDYDERMAVLIQAVQGKRYGRYFMPTIAGVGFSQNQLRWHPKIGRDDGFLRIVWGIGTRAVDRVSDDYPRLVALSHPQLRPETSARAIKRYSQHFVDVIDLVDNESKTLPVRKVLQEDYPDLRYIASVAEDDYIQEILSLGALESPDLLVLTFDYLLKDRKFVKMMRTALRRLERTYETPVDIEFTVEVIPNYPYPDYKLHVLQCRPLSLRKEGGAVKIPQDLDEDKVLFKTYELIPDGKAVGIRYVVFVDPTRYRQIGDTTVKLELGRAIGRLNRILEEERFVLMGPGRWGSANIDLGVRVGYADIFNTSVLIEMSVADGEDVPELSYGTHFFQDLVEGGIYSLPLHLENPRSQFDWAFFREQPNLLATLSPQDADLAAYLRVIDVAAAVPGRRLNILMDGSNDEAVGFLASGDWPLTEKKANVSIF